MLVHLKRKLTLLSGISTSAIVTFVTMIIFFFSVNQENQYNANVFNKNINILVDKIHYSSMINHNWLNEMENDNNLIIYIENRGHPFSYEGYLCPPSDRNILINAAKEQAIKEGLTLNSNPITSLIEKSQLSRINVNDGEYYQCMTITIPYDNSWKTLVVIEWIPNKTFSLLKKGSFFLLINIIACSLLFLLSHIFIGKAVKPVEENNQKQVEFIAAASHELRSPLTVIKTGISSIENDTSNINEYLPHIKSECTRMTRLISDMLLLATADAKTWSLNKELIDMDTFLIETYDLFCPLVASKNMVLNLNLPDEPINNINADKERLRQILTIFIDNAIEYSSSGTDITIYAYNNKNHISIEVIDKGIGISDKQKELIFNRFYRGDKSRSSKKHFGLGLNIAKELIELHNGKLSIKDTPGGGSTFIIEIPC